MAPLIVLGIAVLCALVATVAFVVRRRQGFASAEYDDETEQLPDPVGPVYGLVRPAGPDYAPQPVFGIAPAPQLASYQPHRPVITSPATVRVGSGGAHRRDSDDDEIARLHTLHQAGALSDDEFASLKGRLA